MPTTDPGITTVTPLTDDSWPLFAGLVERHGGIFGGCWCTYFHPACDERAPGYDGSRDLKRRLVADGVAHAALVVRDGGEGEEAVAWAEYGTPAELPGIHHRKQYMADLAAAAEVEPEYRSRASSSTGASAATVS